MGRRADETRNRICEAAYHLFYRRGYNRVGIDDVAEAAGVSKRTVYAHFDSKDTLVGAVMEAQHELALTRIRAWNASLTGDVGDVVTTLFDDLAIWSETRHWTGMGFSRLAMELADLPGHPVRRVSDQHKADVEAQLATTLARLGADEPDRLARQLCLLVEGAVMLTLIHDDRSYIAAAASAARQLAGEGARDL